MNIRKIITILIIILIIGLGVFMYISANTHDTKIEVISNSTLHNGDVITLVLKDSYRNVYPEQVIDVKILDDSGWANKYSVTTDKDGEATVELLGFDEGNYTIHSEYNGTMFLTSSKSIDGLEIIDDYN